MNERSNVVTASLERGRTTVTTRRLWQYDYGMKLLLEDIDLPDSYEVHFSNGVSGEAVTVIGSAEGVGIPDQVLTTGESIHAWLYLHTGENDGETVYHIIIPVFPRAVPGDEPPTPAEQSAVTQAIALLRAGISRAEDAAEEAEAASQAIQDLAVEARTLTAGAQASVEKAVDAEGAVTLHFGIPAGPQGPQGPKGDPGDPSGSALDPALLSRLQSLPDPAAGDGQYVITQDEDQMTLTQDTSPGRLTALEGGKQERIVSASIALSAVWSGNGPYTQTVTVTGAAVTANSKIDLQPTAAQIASLQIGGVTALVIENNAGALTAYALGAAPAAMTVQCTVTEVTI